MAMQFENELYWKATIGWSGPAGIFVKYIIGDGGSCFALLKSDYRGCFRPSGHVGAGYIEYIF